MAQTNNDSSVSVPMMPVSIIDSRYWLWIGQEGLEWKFFKPRPEIRV